MMTPEVREIYDALVRPTTVYCDARSTYEKLRARIIAEVGYDVFRERQSEAFKHLPVAS